MGLILYGLVFLMIPCCQSCPPVRHLSPAHLEVESPGFGPLKTYPPNSNCQWDITIPTGKDAKFSFFAFDLEDVPGCSWDGVEIFRGTCKNRGKSVLRACGINSPSTLTLEGTVCVTFWSDEIGHKRGFQLSVFMDDIESKIKLDQVPQPAASNLNKNEETPQNATKEQNSPVEKLKGHVTASTGSSEGEKKTTFNTIQLVTSTYVTSGTHYHVSVPQKTTATTPPNPALDAKPIHIDEIHVVQCTQTPVVISAGRGRIQSPGYDTGKYPPETTCRWLIRAAENKEIQAEFLGFHLELEANCSWDSLTLYEGDTETTDKQIGKFCGPSLPPKVTSTGSQMLVVFRSDRIVSVKGFLLKFAAVSKVPEQECGINRSTPADINYLIFGGSLADDKEIPWQASVRHDGKHVCGGAVLSPHWVMTAAHCVDMVMLAPYRLTVLVGSSVVTGGSRFSQVVRASEVLLHPTYRYAKSGDVALIRLLEPLKLNDYCIPLCLPQEIPMADFSSCYIAGWGVTENMGAEDRTPSSRLRRADVGVLPQESCDMAYPGRVSQHMFCAASDDGTVDSCKGDSGGPLVCRGPSGRWQALGVISWGGQCGEAGKPGVYTKLQHYASWIRDGITREQPTVNCTFDGFSMCGYQDNSRGPLSWRRRDARFPVSGFSSIRLTKGFYLHVDGPVGRTDLTADLRFPESRTSEQSCLRFTYAVSQTRVIELRVAGDVDGDLQALWSVTGRFQHDWKNVTISLPAGVKDLRLIFKTDSFSRDLVAVDDIEQTEGHCPGSVLDCDLNQADTCRYSLQQNKADIPFVEKGVHLHTQGQRGSLQNPASMKSPLFNSSVSICFTFTAKVMVKSGYFKVIYLTQLNGRSFHGDTLVTKQVRGGAVAIWRTFSVDIPGSPYPRQLVLEFYSGAGPGVAVVNNLRSYDGNCLT